MPQSKPDETCRPTVVLAEDDPELRSLLAFCLYQAGYAVTSCIDGVSLLERIQQGLEGDDPVDLVVTDIRMPGLTGLEVLEFYHDQPRLPPLICMTAFGDEQTHAEARRLRASAIVDKPFDIDLLVDLARKLCPTPHSSKPTRSLS